MELRKAVLFLFPLGLAVLGSVATAQSPEEREQRLGQIERELEGELLPEDRDQLKKERADLHRRREETLRGMDDPDRPDRDRPQEGSPWRNPIILAAVIGAIGAVVAAWISRGKRDRGG